MPAYRWIATAGGTIASVGVHGIKADLRLETPWSRNITADTKALKVLIEA